jgi:hypothetical protein
VQIILILVLKAKIRRKPTNFPADFSADFSFKGPKPKDLNIQELICNKKVTVTKTKKTRTYLQGRKQYLIIFILQKIANDLKKLLSHQIFQRLYNGIFVIPNQLNLNGTLIK